MKSKILHICAMALACNGGDLLASDQENLTNGGGYESLNSQGSSQGGTSQTAPTTSDPAAVLASLCDDVSALQTAFSEANIDTSALAKLQSAQLALSDQVSELTPLGSFEGDFRNFQDALTEVQLLLINLKGGNISAQISLENQIKKISEGQKLLDVDIDTIKTAQDNAIASLTEMTVAEGTISTLQTSISSTQTQADDLKSASESLKSDVIALKSGKATSVNLAKLKALSDSVSTKLADLKKVLGKKAERVLVTSLDTQVKKKADTTACEVYPRN